MNDKFTNNTNREDEAIGQKLDRVANQTNINSQFASELEERLRIAHRPKVSWFAASFKQVSPTLRWVGLVILLGLVLNWSIKSLIPAPQPAADNTPTPEVTVDESATPAPDSGGYNWRGTKLYLAEPLPESPTEANVYLLKPDQHATVEEALALAQRFGIEGEVYLAPGELQGTTDYLVTDGKQRLYVRSENYFTYYADYSTNITLEGGNFIGLKAAIIAIETFLRSHGFDDKYYIEKAPYEPGSFYAVAYLQDGLTIRYDHNLPSRMEFIVTDNSEVISVSSARINYESIGIYGIRSAEEAFQQVLASSESAQNGVLESMRSGEILNESFWSRSYPDNQMITLYGRVTSFDAVDSNKPAFVSIDCYTATGNIPPASPDQLIEATGQFYTENGVRKFNVETWKATEAIETSISGTLRRDGEQTILTADDGSAEYLLKDIPLDVPLNTKIPPDEYLFVNGFLVDNDFIWSLIQYFPSPNSMGGGGGGGGTGFYELNLSGTPVPFPTPTLQPDSNQGTVDYVIQEGDTVLSIAQAYGITPEKIVQANSWLSEEHVLTPGKTLIIPVAQSNSVSVQYIVKEGDTLVMIAQAHSITVDELMQLNGMTDPMIFVGQKLIISRGQVTSGQGIILPEEQLTQLEIDQRLEGERGIFQVNIYEKSQQIWYGFFNINGEESSTYYILEGTDLQNLQAYNNLPVDIWGTVDRFDQYGKPIVKVDRFEIPFPDLKFQIFEGTQKLAEIQGQPVILFTTNDGETYTELTAFGTRFDQSGIFGKEGDEILVEALAIPGESFGGYPSLRMFIMNYAVDPVSGQTNVMTITQDQFNTYEEPPSTTEVNTPPAPTIEKVELIYYIPNPRLTPPDPNAGPQYIQPVWRFYGHYSNGDEFEFLVQALKQEYLLPELAPYTPPG